MVGEREARHDPSHRFGVDSLQGAIRRFEEAYFEARAAWGARVCRPGSDLHHYAANFEGACVVARSVPDDIPDRPEVLAYLAEEFGAVGATLFNALQEVMCSRIRSRSAWSSGWASPNGIV